MFWYISPPITELVCCPSYTDVYHGWIVFVLLARCLVSDFLLALSQWKMLVRALDNFFASHPTHFLFFAHFHHSPH